MEPTLEFEDVAVLASELSAQSDEQTEAFCLTVYTNGYASVARELASEGGYQRDEVTGVLRELCPERLNVDVECYDSDADYSDPDRWQRTFVIDRNAPNFTKAWAETFPADVYCDAADSGSGGFFPQTPIEKQFLAGPDGLSKYTAPVAYAQCVEHGTDSSLNPSWPVDPVSEEQSGGFDNALLLCPDHPDASAWRQVEEDARAAEQAERERQRLIDEGLAFEDGLYRVGEEIQPGTYVIEGAADCYWERQNAAGQVIDNYFGTALRVEVSIQAGDYGFLSEGCGLWRRQ